MSNMREREREIPGRSRENRVCLSEIMDLVSAESLHEGEEAEESIISEMDFSSSGVFISVMTMFASSPSMLHTDVAIGPPKLMSKKKAQYILGSYIFYFKFC